MSDDIDRAFIDRAEELGIKELLAAFAESLTSTRTAANLGVKASMPGYLITTLLASSCRCPASTMRSGGYPNPPERPHDDYCPWTQLVRLFGDAQTKKAAATIRGMYLIWARGVDARPEDQTYRHVVEARDFLKAEEKKSKKES